MWNKRAENKNQAIKVTHDLQLSQFDYLNSEEHFETVTINNSKIERALYFFLFLFCILVSSNSQNMNNKSRSIGYNVFERELRAYNSNAARTQTDVTNPPASDSYFDLLTLVSVYSYVLVFGYLLTRRLTEWARKRLLFLVYRFIYRRRYLKQNLSKSLSSGGIEELDAVKLADSYARICAHARVHSSHAIDASTFDRLRNLNSRKKNSNFINF